MKTLDEVIKAIEECRDSYVAGKIIKSDALHYLKVLKDILDPLKVKNISHEITCPQCNSVIAILLPESNEPLTWDELKAMEGKPVWVEDEDSYSRWEIINGVYDDGISFVGDYYLNKNEFGDVWQAYRKERE